MNVATTPAGNAGVAAARRASTPADLDVRIISLKPEPPALQNVRAHLPQARVFAATDYRDVEPVALYREGKITASALDTLRRGRKWHKELARASAVGLFDSHVRALRSGSGARFMLICEEDCQLKPRFMPRLRRLLESGLEFDVAIFGANIHGDILAVQGHPDWGRIHGMTYFWNLHCVLYSPRGRERAAQLLAYPIDAQLDTIISIHAQHGDIDVLLEKQRSAVQAAHPSYLQDQCAVCNIDSASLPRLCTARQDGSRMVAMCICIIIVVLALCVHAYHRLRICTVRCAATA